MAKLSEYWLTDEPATARPQWQIDMACLAATGVFIDVYESLASAAAMVGSGEIPPWNASEGAWEGFNPNHEPAGSAKGGQFAHKTGSTDVRDQSTVLHFDRNSENQAKRYGETAFADQRAALSRDEVDAIGRYVNDAEEANNAAKRGEKTRDGEIIIAALKRCHLPDDLIIYKGGNVADALTGVLPGNVVRLLPFASTSLSDRVGATFSFGQGWGGLLQLKVPRGTPGLYISGLGRRDRGELEILFPPGLRFRVESITAKGHQGEGPLVIGQVIP